MGGHEDGERDEDDQTHGWMAIGLLHISDSHERAAINLSDR